MPGTCLSYVSLRMLYLRHENQIIVCLILIHQSQSRINIEINNQPHFCVDLCSFCPAAWLSFDFFQSSGERVKTKLEVKPTTLLPILRRVSILSPLWMQLPIASYTYPLPPSQYVSMSSLPILSANHNTLTSRFPCHA